jgi:hypothetical protein
MNNRVSQQIGAWSGVMLIVTWTIVLWPLTHYLPPPSPEWTTADVANLYATNSIGIRLGSILALFAISLRAGIGRYQLRGYQVLIEHPVPQERIVSSTR